MRRTLARVRGLGFILWQTRHMAYHVMLGLLWAWVLRELWNEFNPRWIITAVIGSLLPDADHLNYFLGYGRKDAYSQEVFGLIRRHEWRNLFYFLSTGHKHNTSLSFHNIYVVALFIVLAAASSFIEWQTGVVLFGAIVSHYLFDMYDDIAILGGINANWKRWGNGRKRGNTQVP